MARFQVTSISMEDGPAIANVNIPAFWSDPTWKVIWPGKTLEYVVSQYAHRFPHILLMDRAHRRHQKAIDTETGIIVGYARWTLPEIDGLDSDSVWSAAQVPAVTQEREIRAEAEFRASDYDYDRSLDALDDRFEAIMDRLTSERKYIILNVVAVHPAYWRNGIATRLVESGIRELGAANLGVDILVRAKKAALGIYIKQGFELVEQLIQDASSFGIEAEYGAYWLRKDMRT